MAALDFPDIFSAAVSHNLRALNRRNQVKIRMELTPPRNMVQNIRFMHKAIMDNAQREYALLAAEMQSHMRIYAAYEDQPEDKRDGYGIHARDGLYARVVRSGDVIAVQAGYSGNVKRVTEEGKQYTYGGILETWDEFQDNYSIVRPTMEDFEDRFLNALRNISAKGAKPATSARSGRRR